MFFTFVFKQTSLLLVIEMLASIGFWDENGGNVDRLNNLFLPVGDWIYMSNISRKYILTYKVHP